MPDDPIVRWERWVALQIARLGVLAGRHRAGGLQRPARTVRASEILPRASASIQLGA
ncbi:MAG: hypothetical protein K2Q97_15645 [Burkholderiaceae bacterium]|nr:hypothetical protein [Burkholderiaceae bacterium]